MSDGVATDNIEFTQGDTFTQVYAFQADGAAFDLTGGSVRMQIRREAGGRLVLDCSSMWTIDADPTTGIATLEIPADASGSIPADEDACDGEPAEYVYDIETIDGDGKVATWIRGKAIVTPQVTEP